MRIESEKESLVEVGQAVMRVMSARATLPVLSGVKISAEAGVVEFSATNLEMFVSVVSEAAAVSEAGVVVAPGRLLGDILKSLPDGKVVVESKDNEIKISAGRSEFSVAGYAPGDFPVAPEVGGERVCRVAASDLGRALQQVVRASGSDDARPVLTGVLWSIEGGALKMVATDSYRLALREFTLKESPDDHKAIIPGKALAEFGRQLLSGSEEQAEVSLGESQAALSVGGTRLVTRLIEGEFPNYRQLIPQGYSNRLEAGREGFMAAVARVGLVAQANTPIKVHLGPEVLLTASEAGVAEATEVVEDATYSGDPMVVAFNPRFLGEGLDGVEADRCVLEMGDPTKPVMVKGEGRDEFVYLLMPVRLSK